MEAGFKIPMQAGLRERSRDIRKKLSMLKLSVFSIFTQPLKKYSKQDNPGIHVEAILTSSKPKYNMLEIRKITTE